MVPESFRVHCPPLVASCSRVWYAAYGSNLDENRLRIYLEGGTLTGSNIHAEGSRDRSRPRRSAPIYLAHGLLFAGHSVRWGGAPAFLNPIPGSGQSLCRAYDITWEQFEDIVSQENSRSAGSVTFNLKAVAGAEGRFVLDESWRYNAVLFLGMLDDLPVLTITSNREDVLSARAAPSHAYLEVITLGLRQAYPGMTDEEITDYLDSAIASG